MFCPVCEAEYEAGITRCPDDETTLVDHLPKDHIHDTSEARFVPLFSLGSPAEAEMVNDIFNKNGIRSAVQSGPSDAFAPLLSAVADGAVVVVDERDVDKAQEVYSAFFGDDMTPLTGGEVEEEEE